MSFERRLVQDTYMSLEMIASLEQSDSEALKAEILRQQDLDTPTSGWLEVVSVQYEARDAYRRQKGLWLHLGSTASWSRYANVSVHGRAAILENELADGQNRLGPIFNEISSDATRQQVRTARVAALQEYAGARLVKSFRLKGARPIENIPEIDTMILVSRVVSARQKSQMFEVKRMPGPLQQQALKSASEEAITQLDAQLLGALADH
jgi:hypothetical protein